MHPVLLVCTLAATASAWGFTGRARAHHAESEAHVVVPREDAVAAAAPAPEAFSFVSDNVIYQPTASETVQYSRYAQLTDGTILATVALGGHSPAFFPIFKSVDGGVTWNWISNLNDSVNAWGLTSHPALVELTEPVGDFPEGTILASGGSTNGQYTIINVYASLDRGLTWQYVSRPAVGGPPSETNGGTSVWEPFLVVFNGTVVCYYSDMRDPKHGQKLSHQVSHDLIKWEDPVNDAAEAYEERAGMTVIQWIPTMAQWMLVYEFGIGRSQRTALGADFPVTYRFADDPLSFENATANTIIAVDINGRYHQPNSAPYVTWSPVGGPSGTIIVTDGAVSGVFTNRFGGDVNKWEYHPTPEPVGYGRSLNVLPTHPDHLLIFTGGPYNNPGRTPFTVSVVNITAMLLS